VVLTHYSGRTWQDRGILEALCCAWRWHSTCCKPALRPWFLNIENVFRHRLAEMHRTPGQFIYFHLRPLLRTPALGTPVASACINSRLVPKQSEGVTQLYSTAWHRLILFGGTACFQTNEMWKDGMFSRATPLNEPARCAGRMTHGQLLQLRASVRLLCSSNLGQTAARLPCLARDYPSCPLPPHLHHHLVPRPGANEAPHHLSRHPHQHAPLLQSQRVY
jgi:hypothetical protein